MRRAGRVALATLAGVVVLLVAAQLALPRIAEHHLRSRLERTGQVQSVHISAFPALKLLWHRADDVTVRLRDLRSGTGDFADLLADTRRTDDLDARATTLRLLTLRLTDARLLKRGDRLLGQATVHDADLRAALPPGFTVRPVASGGGSLVFEGTADLLGRRFSGQAAVSARDGRLVLEPDIPFGGLLAVKLFADPRIEVLDVGVRPVNGGFILTGRARLR